MKELKVGIHQPNFMPWIGFFNKIYRAHIFVIIDEVQFAKGNVCNRTRIKNNMGQAIWLTVPIKLENGSTSTFNQTKIADTSWHKKGLNLIKASYINAPYFNSFYPDIEKILKKDYESVARLNITLIKYFCEQFRIKTPIYIQSEIGIEFGRKNYLNLGLTKYFDAEIYLSGSGARTYNDHELFRENGVEIEYLDFSISRYNQVNGDFIENLSILDLLFNEGGNGLKYIHVKP